MGSKGHTIAILAMVLCISVSGPSQPGGGSGGGQGGGNGDPCLKPNPPKNCTSVPLPAEGLVLVGVCFGVWIIHRRIRKRPADSA